MVFMNLSTFQKQVRKWWAGIKGFVKSVVSFRNRFEAKVRDFLDGNNFLNFQFLAQKHSKIKTAVAQNLSVIVPELGIILEGMPVMPESLTPDEIRAQQIGKRMVPHILELVAGDRRLGNPTLHWRWEGDILNSLYVAMEIDQMMYRKRMPEIVATVQCINHAESDICSPQFDSYLTLVKQLPDGERWEEEYNALPDKQDALLKHWQTQIHDWLFKTLGALENDKTATREIKEELSQLLAKEAQGSAQRRMFKMKIDKLIIPAEGSWKMGDLDGKVGYIRVLYANEKVNEDFPTDRVSNLVYSERKWKSIRI
jgi:hypothetical protein